MATDDKYDRQLRLWGSHGQKALMESRLCVLGSSACAAETLKNLVLPGIGNFTLVDSARVEHADLGNNFFLEEADLGKLRAEAVCSSLMEMNPDVQGSHLDKTPAQAIGEGLAFFRPFSLVVSCQLPEGLAKQLDSLCRTLELPLILVTSLGFIGKLRLSAAEHCVCETKPDSELGDLRLVDPFPELRRFADSIDFSSLDEVQHGHVPYVIILIQALDTFRKQKGDTEGKVLPATQQEKEEFKQIVLRMRRSDQELNFAEALDNAYKAWLPYRIPEPVQEVLSKSKAAVEGGKAGCGSTSESIKDFWLVAQAVSQFVRDCGKLPLAGTLPDMTATTDMYVKLQEIYLSRAEGDCAAITAHVATMQDKLGVTRAIPQDFVKRFCQNAQYCEAFTFRSLEEEMRPCSTEAGGVDLAEECSDEDSLIQWYIALRAAERFREERGHWPGALCGDTEEQLASDVAALSSAAARVVESYSSTMQSTEGSLADGDSGLSELAADPKPLAELVRSGGCELHVISSVLGGIAAQEAVKLLTKQYAPLNNTLLYDGLHGKMQTIEL